MSLRRVSLVQCKLGDGVLVDDNGSNESSKLTAGGCNKPLLERRRRARINRSLDQLKALLIGHSPQLMSLMGGANCCKLEKADILELAVEHLRSLQQQHNEAAATEVSESVASNERTSGPKGIAVDEDSTDMTTGTVRARYEAGFADCLAEVERFIASFDRSSHGDIVEHLSARLRNGTRQLSAAAVKTRRNSDITADGLPGNERRTGRRRSEAQSAGSSSGWSSSFNEWTQKTFVDVVHGGGTWSAPSQRPSSSTSTSPRPVDERQMLRNTPLLNIHPNDTDTYNWTAEHSVTPVESRNCCSPDVSSSSHPAVGNCHELRLGSKLYPPRDFTYPVDNVKPEPELLWRPF